MLPIFREFCSPLPPTSAWLLQVLILMTCIFYVVALLHLQSGFLFWTSLPLFAHYCPNYTCARKKNSASIYNALFIKSSVLEKRNSNFHEVTTCVSLDFIQRKKCLSFPFDNPLMTFIIDCTFIQCRSWRYLLRLFNLFWKKLLCSEMFMFVCQWS
jgi:hypothetical protein